MANLPEAQHVDVRREIARFAGVGASGRNVSNVKKILQTAHPRLICALQDGTLTINRALQFCKLAKDPAVGRVRPIQRGTGNQEGDPSIPWSP